MVIPALVFVAINAGSPDNIRGWAIPAATDIAFALGLLALLGSRVPVALKALLLALAAPCVPVLWYLLRHTHPGAPALLAVALATAAIGLALALVGRVVLLLSLTWIMKLTAPLFAVLGEEISGRDIILLAGGLFLLAKATHEIHASMEGGGAHAEKKGTVTFKSVLIQILILLPFSFQAYLE